MNHVDKYYWIINHPKIGWSKTQANIELSPHMVNPKTQAIHGGKEEHLNTEPQWWVEVSKFDNHNDWEEGIPTHYWELDCSGNTAEEAIDNLYNLVMEQYGDY